MRRGRVVPSEASLVVGSLSLAMSWTILWFFLIGVRGVYASLLMNAPLLTYQHRTHRRRGNSHPALKHSWPQKNEPVIPSLGPR